MSQMMIVMNVVGVLLILVAGLTLIPWRKIGEKIFGNDPTKGTIYIEFGEGVEAVHGKYFYSNEKGAMYSYTWRKINQVVGVKADYGYRWLHGRRMIRLANPGDAWASPWTRETLPADVQKSAYDLNALIKGHVGVELVRTIFGAKKQNWVIIIMIIGALLIGYYFYNKSKPAEVPITPPTQQQPAPVNSEGVPYSAYRLVFDNLSV